MNNIKFLIEQLVARSNCIDYLNSNKQLIMPSNLVIRYWGKTSVKQLERIIRFYGFNKSK